MNIALLSGIFTLGLTGCASGPSASAPEAGTAAPSDTVQKELTVEEITKLAKQEEQVVSVGMPDGWANWKDTWTALNTKYGLSHTDTDMSSAEELAKFEAEKANPTADIGDVGISFGPIAVITDKKLVKNPPKSWDDIAKGNYKVVIDDVTKSNQAQMTVLAAAMARGGNEGNVQPGVDFFAELAKQGRLSSMEVRTTNLEKGEVPVALLWDFTALGYRDKIDPNRYEVSILQEGSVVSGYTTIINKYAPHPHAAMLAREYILSDEGQVNLAKGYARPIRTNVSLPEDVKKKLIPADQYQNVKPINDYKLWGETTKQLPQLWQEQVLIHVHMSAGAKQWKKDLLRGRGVTVIEYASDYSKAVEEGRRQAEADENSYFIDDENSRHLFLGYAVAAARLKKQIEEMSILVDDEHPLFVYLPCGVGGGPGGITFGLKEMFQVHVHCFSAEPINSPCMALGLITGLHDQVSVHDFGLDNRTEADGLAVGRPSRFVGKTLEYLLSGVFTVQDEQMFALLQALRDTERISLEPSALAGMPGPVRLLGTETGMEFLKEA